MPAAVFKQTVSSQFHPEFLGKSEGMMRRGTAECRDLGWGCTGRERGRRTALPSSSHLNIDILEWLFSKRACFTV